MSNFVDVYMTPNQVAERLQVDPETVRRWLRAKKLRASRISTKAWRISERGLSEFMEKRAEEQQQEQQPKKAPQAPPKRNFAAFLRDSPLAGSELVFERSKDSPRLTDL